MLPRDTPSPCAADALFAVTPLVIHGRTVGIVRLCEILAQVGAPGLRDDRKIREALIARAGEMNDIPDRIRDSSGDALLAHYHAAINRDPAGGA